MGKKWGILTFFLGCLFSFSIFAENALNSIIVDSSLLKRIRVEARYVDQDLNLAYAVLTKWQLQELSQLVHREGRCGGFELLSQNASLDSISIENEFELLRSKISEEKSRVFEAQSRSSVVRQSEISEALEQLEADNLRNHVEWLSEFRNRYYRDSEPNKHLDKFMELVNFWISQSNLNARVERISHSSIQQDSVKLTIEGTGEETETVVLGGHLDSINQFFFFDTNAPGADDNASGSACLLEAARVILESNLQTQKNIEFIWYAGEEGGLIGSGEIARSYRDSNKEVVAVLQLDMTSVPGSGANNVYSITDYTSQWLRDYLEEINEAYQLGFQIHYSECGYACSDHASWFRQGFDTLMPFESSFQDSNSRIHTRRDVITQAMNFDHALHFSKIALVFALDLGGL